MKKLDFKFIVMFTVIAILCGCSSLPDHLEKENGEYYLLMESNEVTHPDDSCFYPVYPVVMFDSIEEMKNDIESLNFTEEELEAIETFDRDEEGRIMICDLDLLYQPVFPSDLPEYRVEWTGVNYAFLFGHSGDPNRVWFELTSQEYYEREVGNLLDEDNYAEMTSQSEEDRNATVYYYTVPLYDEGVHTDVERKRVIYTYDKDGNTFYVYEYYDVASNPAPKYIDVYGTVADKYVHLYVSNLTVRPSIEWLSSFGLEKFNG